MSKETSALAFLQQFHTERSSSRSTFVAVDDSGALDMLAQFMTMQDEGIRRRGLQFDDASQLKALSEEVNGRMQKVMLHRNKHYYYEYKRPKLQRLLADMASTVGEEPENMSQLMQRVVELPDGEQDMQKMKKMKVEQTETLDVSSPSSSVSSSSREGSVQSDEEAGEDGKQGSDTNGFTINFDSSELSMFGIGVKDKSKSANGVEEINEEDVEENAPAAKKRKKEKKKRKEKKKKERKVEKDKDKEEEVTEEKKKTTKKKEKKVKKVKEKKGTKRKRN